ncbi:hypothetical protein [Corynebacterium sphenisci]|uniref:hypothetical protein n=1 Tax=Corynebacterium sphenisci TaxID=191493 RepID=UPI001475AF9F|nr:hypothetical protein [Corynebacterium sphenisci]
MATAPAGPAPAAAPPAPAYLKARGQALWDSITADYSLTPAALVLLGEACRTADRLERMAGALASGKQMWFELGEEDPDTGGIPIVVNGLLGEARQAQGQLRQTLGQLGVVSVEATGADEPASVLDQLQAKRAARLAAAAGDGA